MSKYASTTTNRLVDSIAKPLAELVDTLLESLIYSSGSHAHSQTHPLCGSLLVIRETLHSPDISPQSISHVYHLALNFLTLIDCLNEQTLRRIQSTIESYFGFFHDFWESYRMFDALLHYIKSGRPTDNTTFTRALREFHTFNRRWNRALMRESMSYREFLLTRLRIYANDTSHIADSHCAQIIASDLFREFHTKRKQRLLTTSLVNKYRI